MRPSALQRHYILSWLFVGSFALLVFATVLAKNFQIASGYFALFAFAAVFVALLLSFVELLSLPSKSAYAAQVGDTVEPQHDREPASRPLSGTTNGTRSEERYVLPISASFSTNLMCLDTDHMKTTRLQRPRHFCATIEQASEGTTEADNNPLAMVQSPKSIALPPESVSLTKESRSGAANFPVGTYLQPRSSL